MPTAYQTSSTTNGTAIFQPPTAPLTAVTGTVLLTLQDTTFIDKATPPNLITASGTPAMRAFTPFASNWGGLFDARFTSLQLSTIPIASTGAFTIEAWIYSTSSSLQCIYSQYVVGSTDTGRMNVLFNDPTGKVSIQSGAGASGILVSASSIPLNIWTHIAIVRDNSNVGKIYINGVLDATNATFTTTIMQATAYVAYTGATPGYGFIGYLSNFRITNTAVYTTNFQPPSAPLIAITGTSLLTLQNNTFIDNATPPNTITPSGAPKTQLLQLPFTSSITKVPAPWNISVTAPLATVGGSMYFNGTTDYLQTPSTAGFAMGTGDFTIELWYYPLSGANSGLFQLSATSGGFYGSAANSLAMNLYINNTVSVYAGNNAYGTGNNKVLYNVWTHIALVRSSGVTKLYLNGVLETSIFTSGSLADTTNYTGTYGVIGGYYSSGYLSNGYISNFRVVKGTAVYTGNFTPPAAPPQPTQTSGLLGTNVNAIDGTNSSLLLLGSNAGIYDATAKNDIVTVGNAQVSSTQIKYGTGAMYFDGTGDWLQSPSSSQTLAFATGDFTVECWVNFATNNGTYNPFVRYDGSGTFDFGYDYSVAQIKYNGSGAIFAISQTFTVGTWYHVALTRASGSSRLFVDGTQVGSTATGDTNNYASGAFKVGGSSYSGSHVMSGYIDDLRITKGVARYTIPFTPPTKAMIGQ